MIVLFVCLVSLLVHVLFHHFNCLCVVSLPQPSCSTLNSAEAGIYKNMFLKNKLKDPDGCGASSVWRSAAARVAKYCENVVCV